MINYITITYLRLVLNMLLTRSSTKLACRRIFKKFTKNIFFKESKLFTTGFQIHS